MLKAGPVWSLGAMAGRSLHGVDAAMILTDGETVFDFGPSAHRPFSPAELATLRAASGQWPGDPAVAAAAEVVETAHAELMARFAGADLAGFHGLTLAHDPGGRGTHQCGNGALLAEVLGLPVVWDFRAADVRLGGQGTPITAFYLFALARRLGRAPVAFLNLGAHGTLTFADPAHALPEGPGALLAFDTGPAGAALDNLMQARGGVSPDAPAAQGTPDPEVIATTLGHPHFFRMAPKSLGGDAFAGLVRAVDHLSDADACATLTATAAAAVAAGLPLLPAAPARILVTGRGRHNPALMAALAARLPCPVLPVQTAGFDGDSLGARAMAHLAVRVARGLPTTCPGTTGVAAAVGGGEISRPA